LNTLEGITHFKALPAENPQKNHEICLYSIVQFHNRYTRKTILTLVQTQKQFQRSCAEALLWLTRSAQTAQV
jgi:hypothetical protein